MNPLSIDLAQAIEHTLLKPEATSADVELLCDQAMEFGFAGVCVNSVHVRLAAQRLASSSCVSATQANTGETPRPFAVVCVVGFPLGAHRTEIKIDEAKRSLDDGATEIDLMVNLGALIGGDRRYVVDEIAAVARVVHARPGRWLKVILETAALPEERIILGCRCCAEGEADFAKTSTGFHPAGGATVEHVRLLVRSASPLRVKAAGGIRTADQAKSMLQAGASRIGTSSGVTILKEWRPDPI